MAYNFQRRNELARERGFTSYGEQRKTFSFAKQSGEFERLTGIPKEDMRADKLDPEDRSIVRTYYQAFQPGDPNDYSLQTRRGKPVVKVVKGKPVGAKAKWLIDIAGYVSDADEWRRRYPNGMRDSVYQQTTAAGVLAMGER